MDYPRLFGKTYQRQKEFKSPKWLEKGIYLHNKEKSFISEILFMELNGLELFLLALFNGSVCVLLPRVLHLNGLGQK
jgi:hypothetical protein